MAKALTSNVCMMIFLCFCILLPFHFLLLSSTKQRVENICKSHFYATNSTHSGVMCVKENHLKDSYYMCAAPSCCYYAMHCWLRSLSKKNFLERDSTHTQKRVFKEKFKPQKFQFLFFCVIFTLCVKVMLLHEW